MTNQLTQTRPYKNYALHILLFILMSVLFVNCQKDDDPNEEANNKLNGNWDVESFRIDGEEQVLYTISSFEIQFNKETEISGETEWKIIDIFGSTTVNDWDYEIMSEGLRIDIDGDEFNLDINDDFMSLDGNVDGYFWEIDAEKE